MGDHQVDFALHKLLKKMLISSGVFFLHNFKVGEASDLMILNNQAS
jgi:hypothetical protein